MRRLTRKRWAVMTVALATICLAAGCRDRQEAADTSVVAPEGGAAIPGDSDGAAADRSLSAVEVDEGMAQLNPENTSVVIRSQAADPSAAGAWEGRFGQLSGQLQVEGDQPTALAVEFETTSLQAKDLDMTQRLSSAEFLNTAEFSTGRFEATRFEPAGEASGPGRVVHITGNLMLAGETQEITAPAVVQVQNGQAAISISMQLDRDAFGMAPYQEDVENTFQMAIEIGQQEKLQ